MIKNVEDAKLFKEQLEKLRHSKNIPILIFEENLILKRQILIASATLG